MKENSPIEHSIPEILGAINQGALNPTVERPRHPEEPPSPERIQRGREEFQKRKTSMILSAIRAHVEAISYRKFRVGACTLAEYDFGPDKSRVSYKTEATHNAKFIKHHQPRWGKLCAENNGCYISIQDGASYISALATACEKTVKEANLDPAEHKIDENKSEKATHPCENCRNLFRELIRKNYMSEDTVICCVNDEPLVELYSSDEIDENDQRTFMLMADGKGGLHKIPRLKFKNGKADINEKDIAGLSVEEIRLGDLLRLYPEDLKHPFRSGGSAAPDTEVFSKEDVILEFLAATQHTIETYRSKMNKAGADPAKASKALAKFIKFMDGITSDALNHGVSREELWVAFNQGEEAALLTDELTNRQLAKMILEKTEQLFETD